MLLLVIVLLLDPPFCDYDYDYDYEHEHEHEQEEKADSKFKQFGTAAPWS